jgi:hypothetical protein
VAERLNNSSVLYVRERRTGMQNYVAHNLNKLYKNQEKVLLFKPFLGAWYQFGNDITWHKNNLKLMNNS